MFLAFLEALRAGGIAATLTEHLALLGALRASLPGSIDVDDFYVLARATYCRDETQLDRFDRVFGQVFRGALAPAGGMGWRRARCPRSGCTSSPSAT